MRSQLKTSEALRLIVNADDLGASVEINDAVFEKMAQGALSSATIMANGDAAEDAVRRSRAFPQCSFGIHLVATEFRPLSGDRRLLPLLDSAGRFRQWRNQPPRDPRLLGALLREFSEQVAFLQSRGVLISHIDSHHHVHTIPMIFPILAALVRRFSIRSVRITRNLFRPDEQVQLHKRLAKAAWISAVRQITTVSTTDYFGTPDDLAAQPHGFGANKVAEIMLHPGNDRYRSEQAVTLGNWHQSLPFSVSLINYNEL